MENTRAKRPDAFIAEEKEVQVKFRGLGQISRAPAFRVWSSAFRVCAAPVRLAFPSAKTPFLLPGAGERGTGQISEGGEKWDGTETVPP